MSYQVLARKWRPKTFREMAGQSHVLKALVNALDHDRLHHAYLFTGTRGVGKTTIARILAKCLNCETGVSSAPCGSCDACTTIDEGRFVDLIEVDAASRTKVEDTRELLENVQYAPTRGRYKVYLIDEVHMLTGHSFNALLKTLEEPPPHVKFLLATTDPQKIPATILSRCLQFSLKNMTPERIVEHVRGILDAEMVAYDDEALWLIGRAAQGSMRDALSLTDQAIAFGSGKLGEADVRQMLGSIDIAAVYRLVEGLSEGSGEKLLECVADLAEHGLDFNGVLEELLLLLHRMAIAQTVPSALDNSLGDRDQVIALASGMTAEDTQFYYQMALSGRRDMSLAPDLRCGFEMLLLRMLAFKPAGVHELPDAALKGDSGSGEPAPAKKPMAPEPSPAPEPQVHHSAIAAEAATGDELPVQVVPEFSGRPEAEVSNDTPVVPPEPEAASPDMVAVPRNGDASCSPILLTELTPGLWCERFEDFGLPGMLGSVASHCALQGVDQKGMTLWLDEANASLFNDSHRERLQSALSEYFHQELKLVIHVQAVDQETPARYRQRRMQENLATARQALENDTRVQALIREFDASIDIESIKPITAKQRGQK